MEVKHILMKKNFLFFNLMGLLICLSSCQCSKNKSAEAHAPVKFEEAPKHNAPDQTQIDSLKNNYKKR